MITCPEAVQLMWHYLDGVVEVDDRVLVEEHLARCLTCCGELEFVRELRVRLAGAGDDELSPDALRRLTETIERLGR